MTVANYEYLVYWRLELVPGGAIPPMFDPQSPVLQRANVIGHTLWVTPNHRD